MHAIVQRQDKHVTMQDTNARHAQNDMQEYNGKTSMSRHAQYDHFQTRNSLEEA